jgi:hypothetical protein
MSVGLNIRQVYALFIFALSNPTWKLFNNSHPELVVAILSGDPHRVSGSHDLQHAKNEILK